MTEAPGSRPSRFQDIRHRRQPPSPRASSFLTTPGETPITSAPSMVGVDVSVHAARKLYRGPFDAMLRDHRHHRRAVSKPSSGISAFWGQHAALIETGYLALRGLRTAMGVPQAA